MSVAAPRAEDAALVASAELVAWELERRGIIPPDFTGWCKRARPEFDWSAPFFRHLHAPLNALTAGHERRVLYQVAVRHSKTESLIGYCAYRIERAPTTRILMGTYNAEQAAKFSRTVRRIVRTRGVQLSREADASREWETVAGGGMRALGIGTGTASINADLIVIDDPIANRRQAESATERAAVLDAIRSDFLARAEPHTQVVFAMPRWHHDDPSAHLQRLPGWRLVDMPAIAGEADAIGRRPGELLWPEFRPQSWLDEMREELGRYAFNALVLCRPTPRDGGQFRWDWIRQNLVDACPRDVVARCRYWDTAGTADDGDYTAGVRVSRGRDGYYYIEHVERGQWSPGERDMRMRARADKDAAELGGPHTFEIGIERPTGQGGAEATMAIVRALAGYRVFTDFPGGRGSKELRRDPVAAQMEVGNVRIVRDTPQDRWNQPFFDELLALPGGVYDDQGDALAGAFARVSQRRELGVMQLRIY